MGQAWAVGRQTNNNGPSLWDISCPKGGLLLNNGARMRRLSHMKPALKSLALGALLALTALPAAAECYADYKAKRDNPLKLQYGVISLPDRACGSTEDAAEEIAARIAVDGWTLLDVVSIFDAAGLADEKRKESAGDYFLRY